VNVHLPRRPENRPVPSDGRGDLAQLLATEQRLEAMVMRAKDQAAALVATARAEAAAREATVATELEAGLRELEARIAADQGRREEELAETMRQETRSFDEVGADRVEALARYVVARIIGAAP
jgi:hypothetical protein